MTPQLTPKVGTPDGSVSASSGPLPCLAYLRGLRARVQGAGWSGELLGTPGRLCLGAVGRHHRLMARAQHRAALPAQPLVQLAGPAGV